MANMFANSSKPKLNSDSIHAKQNANKEDTTGTSEKPQAKEPEVKEDTTGTSEKPQAKEPEVKEDTSATETVADTAQIPETKDTAQVPETKDTAQQAQSVQQSVPTPETNTDILPVQQTQPTQQSVPLTEESIYQQAAQQSAQQFVQQTQPQNTQPSAFEQVAQQVATHQKYDAIEYQPKSIASFLSSIENKELKDTGRGQNYSVYINAYYDKRLREMANVTGNTVSKVISEIIKLFFSEKQ